MNWQFEDFSEFEKKVKVHIKSLESVCQKRQLNMNNEMNIMGSENCGQSW